MSETATAWVLGLKNPECYPHRVDQVRLVETHISWVFLTGSFAYKIKKPVKYSFVDFSTLERRRWFCEEEVRLNRRLAPDVYLGIVSITGSPAHPRFEGQGAPFECAVKMKQFSSDQDISDILANREKAKVCIFQLADRMATFHVQIEKAEEHTSFGSPDQIWQAINECLQEIPLHLLTQDTQGFFPQIERWVQAEWRKLSDVFLCRKYAGFVRECHGDLHLGNIAMFEGSVCVFDALEFEPRLRWIDVMSEIAFLVMDLEYHGRQDLASMFLNQYLELTGDYEGLKVIRLYQVYRAIVRAKVAGLRLAQLVDRGKEEEKSKEELTGYIELAHRVIARSSPALILMHGVSGTGKTTVSTEIIKTIGAIRIRSDVERKRLCAEPVKLKRKVSADVDLYHSDMTARTYDRLRDLARTLMKAGFVVVVDATFLRHHQRQSFRMLSDQLGCASFILDVSAPKVVLAERIEQRSVEGYDASDATVDIMERQEENKELFTQEEELYVIRVNSTDPESILFSIRELQKKTRS